jgi:hypothetical protein
MKAIEKLTINADRSKLEDRLNQMTQRNRNTEYLLNGKILDKDKELAELKFEIEVIKQGQKELFELLKPVKKLLKTLDSE